MRTIFTIIGIVFLMISCSEPESKSSPLVDSLIDRSNRKLEKEVDSSVKGIDSITAAEEKYLKGTDSFTAATQKYLKDK